ncbi:MAG: hypothetical protein ACREIB_00100, partial [Pseudomonadota bacterium]
VLDKLSTTDEALDRTADLVEKAFTAVSVVAFGAAMKKTVTAIVDVTEKVAAQAERIGQLTEITGLSAQRLQEWGAVFQGAGGSIEDLTQGTRVLSQHMLAAAEGSEESRAAFARIGLEATQIGSDTETAFTAVIDQLAKMPPGFERTAVAAQLLGRGAANLLPIFAQGSEHFKRVAEEALAMGAVLSGPQLAALQKTDDAFDRLNLASEGLGRQIAAAFAPSVAAGVNLLADSAAFVTRVFQETVVVATTLTARFVALIQHTMEIAAAINDLTFFTEAGRDALHDRMMAIEAEKEAIITNVREELAKLRAVEAATAAIKQSTQSLASQEAIGKLIVGRTSQMAATWQLARDIQERLGSQIVANATALYQNQVANDEVAAKAARVWIDSYEAQEDAALARVDADIAAQGKAQEALGRFTTDRLSREYQAARSVRGFWLGQAEDFVKSNVFSLSQITTNLNQSVASWIVTGTGFQQFWQSLQQTLITASLQFIEQAIVQAAIQEAAKTSLAAAGAAQRIGIATAEATTTVSIFSGMGTAVYGIMATVGSAIAAVGATIMTTLISVGQFVVGMLSAIASALEISVFGIPAGILVAAGAAVLAGYLASQGEVMGAIMVGVGGLLAGAAGLGAFSGAESATGSLGSVHTMGFGLAAEGAYVTGPQLMMVGEGRQTETILPFDVRDLDGRGGGEQHFYNIIDGRMLSHIVLRNQPRVAYLHGME